MNSPAAGIGDLHYYSGFTYIKIATHAYAKGGQGHALLGSVYPNQRTKNLD
jgi:hypothetical protein